MRTLGVRGVIDTHASQIDAGIDVVTIAKRLGHSSAAITLKVYAHLFRNDDSKAAAAINAALAGKPIGWQVGSRAPQVFPFRFQLND